MSIRKCKCHYAQSLAHIGIPHCNYSNYVHKAGKSLLDLDRHIQPNFCDKSGNVLVLMSNLQIHRTQGKMVAALAS